MSDFEAELRARLAQRAGALDLESDVEDLGSRIHRDRRRRDAIHNAVALSVSGLVIIGVVVLAYVTTGGNEGMVRVSQSVTSTTQPPGTGRASESSIKEAYATVFEPGSGDVERLGWIDDPEGLLPVVDLIHAIAPEGSLDTLRVDVRSIRFLRDDFASVQYVITSTDPQYPGALEKVGGAVYEDGRWKMQRLTFCQAIAVAGVLCPEHEPAGYVPPSTPRLPTTTSSR
jgi:hypothetical protein